MTDTKLKLRRVDLKRALEVAERNDCETCRIIVGIALQRGQRTVQVNADGHIRWGVLL